MAAILAGGQRFSYSLELLELFLSLRRSWTERVLFGQFIVGLGCIAQVAIDLRNLGNGVKRVSRLAALRKQVDNIMKQSHGLILIRRLPEPLVHADPHFGGQMQAGRRSVAFWILLIDPFQLGYSLEPLVPAPACRSILDQAVALVSRLLIGCFARIAASLSWCGGKRADDDQQQCLRQQTEAHGKGENRAVRQTDEHESQQQKENVWRGKTEMAAGSSSLLFILYLISLPV